MAKKFYDLDLADLLKSNEAMKVFLADAFETGDAQHFAIAQDVVARAKVKSLKSAIAAP